MMVRMRREKSGTEEQITPQIDNLVLIDRTVDLLTPFLSQLTYEGFIDELFNIENSKYYFQRCSGGLHRHTNNDVI